jgi:hypothetical protein
MNCIFTIKDNDKGNYNSYSFNIVNETSRFRVNIRQYINMSPQRKMFNTN